MNRHSSKELFSLAGVVSAIQVTHQASAIEELERFDRAELSSEDFFTIHSCTRDEMQELAAWIASQGRDYYSQVFNNPVRVPRVEEMKESNFDGVVHWRRI